MTLTRRQRQWLAKVIADGELTIGGLDQSKPAPQLRTCVALRDLGLLKFKGSRWGYSFTPTEEAREIVNRYETLTPGEHLSCPL